MKSISLYRRMVRYMAPYWPGFVLSGAASMLIVAFDALSLWITATLFSSLFNAEAAVAARPQFSLSHINDILKYWTFRAIRADSKLDSLRLVCLIMAGTFALKNVLAYLQGLLVVVLNLKIVRNMRNDLYRHALCLPVTYYDRNRSGNIISLVLNDISVINSSMINTLPNLVVDPLRLLCFIALLVIISPWLTLVLFVLYPALMYLILVIGKTVRRRSRRVLNNFSGMISVLSETVQGIRAVKMFNMSDTEGRRFAAENEAFTRSEIRSYRMRMLSSPLTETLGIFVAVVLLWYAGRRILTGQGLAAEDFVRYLAILVSSYQPFKRLANVHSSIQAGIAAADRVINVLDRPPENLRLSAGVRIPLFEKEIRYAGVHFTYPECSDEVLRGIDFTVRKGDIVALVGPSGSGKTTVLDLLPRFYDITAGSITIDGTDIRNMDLAALRSLFGIVSQETFLFNDTVRNNIAYGRREASGAEIEAAARAANAFDFILDLPRGFDTVIGERGDLLSGGQRQRIAIARALLRNPPILILDEATSALDTESERQVQEAINTLMTNRTVIAVAHRLSTILHANAILVLEDGHIIEQGNHHELYEKSGRYRQIYDMQFATPALTTIQTGKIGTTAHTKGSVGE